MPFLCYVVTNFFFFFLIEYQTIYENNSLVSRFGGDNESEICVKRQSDKMLLGKMLRNFSEKLLFVNLDFFFAAGTRFSF